MFNWQNSLWREADGLFWRAGVVQFYKRQIHGDNVNVQETSMTEALRRWRIIPVIVIEDPKNAPNVAAALMAGGLPIAEITLRTKGHWTRCDG